MLKSIDFENKLDIKKFKRGKYINSGACGDVYQSKYNNRNVISKRLNIKDYYDEQSWIEDAILELNNYKYISNTKYCCQLIGYCYNNSNIYLLLNDYNVIGDLYDFLNQEKYWLKYNRRELFTNEFFYQYKNDKWIYNMDRKLKVNITKELLNAIYELHSRNIVHCDLKSNNILYKEKTNQIILIDFNASHYIDKKQDKIK